MSFIEPTYLRYVHDELNKGSISSDNASSLPYGFVGLFEKEFSSDISSSNRIYLLRRLNFWALLKKEVSIEFVSDVLKEDLDSTKALINRYSKWFNSPEPGKYILFHDRLRSFLLQKLSDHEVQELNEQLIAYLEDALETSTEEESNSYALEHLSTHMAVESQLGNNYERLHDFVNREDLWSRQVSTSKEYKWSQKGVQLAIKEGARRHDEKRALTSTINSLKVNQNEQSDFKSIIEFFYLNEHLLAIDRLENLDDNLRYKLSILFIHDLTIGELKGEPFVKDVCSLLIKSISDLTTNFKGEGTLNWSNHFKQDIKYESEKLILPVTLMYLYHCKLKEIGIDDSCLWRFNIDFDLIICDDRYRNECALKFSEKTLSNRKNDLSFQNKDNGSTILFDKVIESKSNKEYNVNIRETPPIYFIGGYFSYSFVESCKYISIDKIDFLDLTYLVGLSTLAGYEKSNYFFKILSYHFKRNIGSEKKLIKTHKHNNILYYSLPGDEEIISAIKQYNLPPSFEDGIQSHFDFCEKLNKILFEESSLRSDRYNLKWNFFECLNLSKELIQNHKLIDNIFSKLNHFIKVIESKSIIDVELKLFILETSNNVLKNANIHKAHIATAFSYMSEIYFLLDVNNIDKSLDYFNKAFENKVSLILNYNDKSNSENEIGNINELFNSGLKILIKLISKKDDKLIEPLILNLLTLLKHELNLNHENLIENYILIKNKEEVHINDDDNFFSFFNYYLNLLKGLINDDVKEINLDKHFQYFNKIINEFKIDYALSISNSDTVNLIEKYLRRFDGCGIYFSCFNEEEKYEDQDTQDVLKVMLSSSDSFFSKPFFWNYYLISQKLIIHFLKNGDPKKSTILLEKFIQQNTYSKFINEDLIIFFKNKEILFLTELLTTSNVIKNNDTISLIKNNYDLEFIVELVATISDLKKTINKIDIFLEHILIESKNFEPKSIIKLNEFLLNIILIRRHLVNKNKLSYEYDDLIKLLIDLLEESFDTDSEYLIENINSLNKVHFRYSDNSKGHDDLLNNEVYEKILELKNPSLFDYYISKIGKKITSILKLFDFENYNENITVSDGNMITNDFAQRICSSEYLHRLMLKWKQIDKAKYCLKCFNIYLDRFLNEIENFLMYGFVLYNPIDRQYENKKLSLHISGWEEGYSMIILFEDYFYDLIEEKRRSFIESFIPNEDQYNEKECFFDLGYLLLLIGKTNKAIKLIEDKIKDSSSRFKSMIYFYYCKHLLSVNNFKNATDLSQRIQSKYFKTLYYFELYKANKINDHEANSYLSKCLDLSESIKVEFEKSSLYLKIYKELLSLKELKLAEQIKKKIEVDAYKLCSEVLSFSNSLNNKKKVESIEFINKIKKQEKALIYKYDSNLKIEISNLEKQIHNTSTPNKILVNSESGEQTVLYSDSKMDEKYYLTFHIVVKPILRLRSFFFSLRTRRM